MSVKKQDFRHIIKQARIKHNFTQERLAEALDISSRYMMSIEGGQRSPSLSLFFQTIRILEIDANQIIYPERNISDEEKMRANLSVLLSRCNQHQLNVMIAVAHALLENT